MPGLQLEVGLVCIVVVSAMGYGGVWGGQLPEASSPTVYCVPAITHCPG